MEIKTCELMSAWIQLAQASGDIARQVKESGVLEEQWKGENDPVTQADIQSEIMIISTLKNIWPDIIVVGEEGASPNNESILSDVNLNVVDEGLLPEDKRVLTWDSVVVWVDPLDGTNCFVTNDLTGVTCLIGVALNGKPIAGVLHHTFAPDQPTYYGGPGMPMRVTTSAKADQGNVVAISAPQDSRSCFTTGLWPKPEYQQLYESASLNTISASGTGRKAINTIMGQAAAGFYPGSGTAKWDICAPEALFESMGGRLVDIHGEKYSYVASAEHKNQNGYIWSVNPQLLDEIVSSLKNIIK